MLSSRSKALLASLALISLTFGGMAVGSKAHAGDEARKKDFMLPTVEVTADKRTSIAQKTPLTMEVITAKDIEDAGIKSVEDVFKRIPNLVVSTQYPGSATHMTYRGVHSAKSTEANPIAFYVDDVPMESFYSLDVNLQNIERIEILKGAQGVVYGKNAFAGIVRIITKQPGNEFASRAFTGVDSHGGYEVGGTTSGPIYEDRLFYSLSMSHETDRGYLRATGDTGREKKERNRAKGQLLYTPSDDSKVAFHFDYTQKDLDRAHYGRSDGSVTMRSLASEDDKDTSKALNLAVNGSFTFDNVTFDSISTYRFENNVNFLNYAPINGSGNSKKATDRTEVTQELRIKSNNDGNGLNWLLGVYGSYTDWEMYDGYFDMTTRFQRGKAETRSTEFAPFGQLDYTFADSWKLTAGLRWFNLHRKGDYKNVITGLFPINVHVKPEGTWSEFLPRLNLSYTVDDDKMVYAGISRSALPGGMNWAPFSANAKVKYDTQTAWNYEVGAKTQWLDDTLRINPVLFYSIYEDLQELYFDGMNFTASNPGKKATAYGAEVDMVYLITPQIQLDANIGLTKAYYNEYVGNDGADGKRMLMSPEYTARVGMQYRGESGFFIRGDVNHIGEFYWNGANTLKRGATTLVDARVGWEFDSFDVYLYGKNITDQRYLDFYAKALGLAYTADPGTYGLELAARF